MKSGVEKSRARVWWVAFLISSVVFSISSPMVQAKSVFAVSSHASGKVKAYHIDPNGAITFQATITNPMAGATGLSVWPAKDRLFVTYEQDNIMSWASLRTLSRDPQEDDSQTGTGQLAGMAVDENQGLLYAIQRGSNKLYAFDYDPSDNTLIPVDLSETTMYRELTGVTGGMDVAIDPQGSQILGIPVGRLYASDCTSNVRYYNEITWDYEGTIPFQRYAIGIGLDTVRGWIYAGNFDGGGGHSYLMRCNLNGDPNSYVEKNMGTTVMDIAVDEETGLIYLTTSRYYNGRAGAIEVYDPANWNADPNSLVLVDIENDADFGDNGPGGIAIGPTYKIPRMFISKQDDKTACVSPQELITYTIAYHPDRQNETNVIITDKLPPGVDFVSVNPNTGIYNERPAHSYVWELGDVTGVDPNTPGDPNYYFSLTVQVNNLAEPAGSLVNTVEAESDEALATAKETTPVCCWDTGVIYVKYDATGSNAGTSWENAYTDLQDAIARINTCGGSEIWVAGGIYNPGTQTTDSFIIPDDPDDVAMYGGFAGWETSLNQRNIPANPTILTGNTGLLDYGVLRRNTTVVTMGNNSILDGFIVKEASDQGQGILGQNNINFTVFNCSIEDNQRYGLFADNGNASVKWCIIKNNGYDGIYHKGYYSKTFTVENCQILENEQNGIYTEFSIPTIRNNMICFNGTDDSDTYYGLYLFYPQTGYDIRNNTVVYNVNEGIGSADPNTTLNIYNCIVWGNKFDDDNTGNDDEQLTSNIAAYYSCVWDPNNIHISPDANGNISCSPGFVYPCPDDPNVLLNLHLLPDSHCIDKGDPGLSYADQNDIDGETRLMGVAVDMGADEIDDFRRYQFDETEGLTAYDSGPVNQYDGVLMNGSVSEHGPVWEPNDGVFNGALRFDGVNDYVEVPGYYGIGGTHSRTVSVWFKTRASVWQPGGAMPYNIPFVQWGHDATGELWMVYLRPDRKASVAAYGGGVYGSKPLNDGLWHNIVAILEEGESNSANIKLYVDGELDIGGSSSCTINTDTEEMPVHIGAWCRYNGGNPYFAGYAQGLIDDVRIYQVAWDADDVKNYYLSARVAQLRDEAVIYYNCDEGTGTTLNDRSWGDQQNGTLYNGVGWSTSGAFGKAISFDGVNDYAKIPSYNGISGTHARSVSVWFKTSAPVWQPGGAMPYNIPFVQWGHDATGELWMVYLRPDRKASVAAYGGGVYGSKPLNDGLWHNIVAILEEGESNSANIKLYVDGELDIGGSSSCTINTDTEEMPVHIGAWCRYNGGNPYFAGYAQGLIDDVRIYDKALSVDDIQIIYREFQN